MILRTICPTCNGDRTVRRWRYFVIVPYFHTVTCGTCVGRGTVPALHNTTQRPQPARERKPEPEATVGDDGNPLLAVAAAIAVDGDPLLAAATAMATRSTAFGVAVGFATARPHVHREEEKPKASDDGRSTAPPYAVPEQRTEAPALDTSTAQAAPEPQQQTSVPDSTPVQAAVTVDVTPAFEASTFSAPTAMPDFNNP